MFIDEDRTVRARQIGLNQNGKPMVGELREPGDSQRLTAHEHASVLASTEEMDIAGLQYIILACMRALSESKSVM